MTLKEQLIQELENLNPATLADLQELKFKYRNLCTAIKIEGLAMEYIRSMQNKPIQNEAERNKNNVGVESCI